MAKVIDKTVLSRKSPKTSALWAYPKDNDSVELRIFNNGEWQSISGTGSSSSSDSSGCECNNIIIKTTFDEDLDTYVYSLEKGNFEDAYTKLMSGEFLNIKIYKPGYNKNNGFAFMIKEDLNTFGAKDNMIYLKLQNDGELVWTSDGISKSSGGGGGGPQ